MELKFSVTGIPHINFDDDKADKADIFVVKHKVRLSFVSLIDKGKIFKYVAVKGYRSTILAKRNLSIIEREDFLADVHLNGFPKGFTGDECHNFTKHKYTFLRKVLRKYIVEHEDGDYIRLASMKTIAKRLKDYSEPKKRLRKKKRVRNGVVYVTAETIAEKKAKKKKEKEKARKKREKEVKDIEKKLNGKRKKKTKPKRLKRAKPTKTVENKLGKTCTSCDRELFTVTSCNSQMIVGHGERWMPVIYRDKKPCKACGVLAGGRHHLYCPHEECPRCKGKFVSCGCF